MSTNFEKKSLTPHQVAEIYGIPVGSLANWRVKRQGPRYYKVGRKVMYWVDDLQRWLKRQPVQTLDSLPEDFRDEK